MNDENDLTLALRLADLADGHTAAAFGAGHLAASRKHDGSLVSAVDLRVERSLRAELKIHRPDDGFLGEETPPSEGGPRRWVVDPIDHTNNFVRGIPAFATLIAMMVDDVVDIGVVSAPALGRRWWARRGHGSFTDGGRPLRVSAVADLADAYLSFAAVHVWQERGCLTGIVDLSRRTRYVVGSGGFLAHMMVAEGLLEASLDPWGEVWDLAPIQVIVEEAGGVLTDASGAARADGGCAVVTNGVLHDTILSVLGTSGRRLRR